MVSEDESDISDYYNNDTVHTFRGIGSSKFFKRLGYLSGSQLRFIIMAGVTKKVYDNPDKYPYAGDVFALIGDEIALRSLSVSGKGLGFIQKIVGKIKDVKDTKILDKEGKKDLEEL